MKTALICAFGAGALLAACSGSDDKKELFTPKPECDPNTAVTPYAGSNDMVISSLAIGAASDGFDLDGDGKPDNKLAAVGSLAASSIQDSFNDYTIVIPMEFYDLPGVQATTCTKFAVYLGAYVPDVDGDGSKPYIKGGDCNDHDASVHPGATEIAGNGIDEDCDGKADDVGGVASTSDVDADGDGVTIAQGDCDDTNAMVHPGMKEICGDGLDNDCDGVADRSVDANGNVTACSPFDPVTPSTIPLDPLSFNDDGTPAISFKDGTITANADGTFTLNAGPDLFGINIPVGEGITLDLKITGAQIQANVTTTPTGIALTNGRLGGVIDAKTADTIRGITETQIGLTAQDSLLDAIFANVLGPVLALPLSAQKAVQMNYKGCRTPDIDVDGDGLEAFCDSQAGTANDMKTVDVCIDGDGTVVMDTTDGSGNTVQCTTAVDKNGKPRFVDGISVELNFGTTPIKAITKPVTAS